MRKLWCILFFVFSTHFLFAQSSLLITGDTVFFGDPNFQMSNHLTVKNSASSPMSVLCRKTNLTIPSGAQTNFCWAGSCFAASTTVSPLSAIIPAGHSISYPDDTDAHTGYYDAFGVNGIARVEYCFYNEQDPSDMTCVVVRYDGSGTSSLSDQLKENSISEFFPNPAVNRVYLEHNLTKPGTLKVMDILGNIVKEVSLSGIGTKYIFIGDLVKGIYFANLTIENEIQIVKKLVIKK